MEYLILDGQEEEWLNNKKQTRYGPSNWGAVLLFRIFDNVKIRKRSTVTGSKQDIIG